jgi:hypothetical protein
MNFKPILFSTEMVQAILRGEKTQTRRIVKIQPKDLQNWKISRMIETTSKDDRKNEGKLHWITMENESSIKEYDDRYFDCKYLVGDILWVRETWGIDYFGSAQFWHFKHGIDVKQKDIVYKADDENRDKQYLLDKVWKPSIFMPKEVCRIFLKLKSIRIERLNDISEKDAISEGVQELEKGHSWLDYYDKTNDYGCGSAKASYMTLWCKINGSKSWSENPFVWIYEFERCVASFACS